MNYKEVFAAKYDRISWLKLLHDVFQSKAKFDIEPYKKINVSSQLAKEALYLGKIMLSPSEELAVYEVELANNVDILRNRRGIRDMLTSDWRNQGFVGAFVLSFRKRESILRFSYISEIWGFNDKNEYVKTSTDTKRFTYLLGKGYSCRTADEQFQKLRDSDKTLADVTAAFNVEALSREFFGKYKEHYERFVDYMVDTPQLRKEFIDKDFNRAGLEAKQIKDREEKPIRDYVKKLLGRIVFLHFLQKKGWLGVPADGEWGEGDSNFMFNLFDKASDEQKRNFLDGVLEPLFADALDTDRKADNHLFDTKVESIGTVRIPYLNGGLFERDELDEKTSVFPPELFNNLLETLSQYNFTIDENDPNDAEVGVDPEMLGRIFENLLEDNKDKGAYYTPKEIVQYMCRESLIAYLQTDENAEVQDCIRQFVIEHDARCLNELLQARIEQKLREVKICDPAVGSGAFPMGLLRELFFCRCALDQHLQEKAADIKRDIIQKNIYGVDIERGAVDIARLRFWLALVVDEKDPNTLPNLDFKIMQGNSLLESYKGVDLCDLLKQKKEEVDVPNRQLLLIDDKVDILRKNLNEKINKYYSCGEHQQRQQLRHDIEELVRKQLHVKGYGNVLGDVPIYENGEFFLWHTWFNDVFSREGKEGFDIVIGNPPYIEAKKLKCIANTLKGLYKVYSGTADFSVYFDELGLNLLREGGILSLITTNKFFNTEYGKKVRGLIANLDINIILNFEQVEVFENVLVSSVIFNISKQKKRANNQFVYEKFYKLKSVDFKRQFVDRQNALGLYSQDYLDSKEWSFANREQLSLKEKIEKGCTLLEKVKGVKVCRGVTTGYNPAFIINGLQREGLISEDRNNAHIIKNMLQGRNIRKWYYDESDEYLIFTRRGINMEQYPAIKKHLYNFYKKLKPKTADDYAEGRKPGNYKWFEILDNTAYYPEFEREEKIIWGLTADKWAFTLDKDKHYLPSNAYILTSTVLPIRFILGLLNSRLLHYYFGFIGVMTAGGAYTLKAATIEAMPIPSASIDVQHKIASLVEDILRAKASNNGVDVSEKEKAIDNIVYGLYGLNRDDIDIIECS